MFFYPSYHVGISSNVRQSTGVWQEALKWFIQILEILNQISWYVSVVQYSIAHYGILQYSAVLQINAIDIPTFLPFTIDHCHFHVLMYILISLSAILTLSHLSLYMSSFDYTSMI